MSTTPTNKDRYGDRLVSAVLSKSNAKWLNNNNYKKADLINAGLYLLRMQSDTQVFTYVSDALIEKGRDIITDRYNKD